MWADFKFPPLNLWNVWPRYDQWYESSEDWWY